jgi:hypothetical protein
VGVYSTALLEGMAFGVQTVLVQLPGSEQLAFLWERGLARAVRDLDALEAAVCAPDDLAAASGELLWTREPAARFSTFIERFFR